VDVYNYSSSGESLHKKQSSGEHTEHSLPPHSVGKFIITPKYTQSPTAYQREITSKTS
jgi:hypothetical protein